MKREYVVYAHICKIPSEHGIYKRYIGITSQTPENRWKNGYGYKSLNKNGEYTHFYKAILKHGWDNFEHKIIAHGLTKEQAERLEVKLIKYYNTLNGEYGYNSTEGGNSNVPSEETIEKIRRTNTGKRHTEATKQKLSKIFKGCKNPKISASLKKYYETHEGTMKNKKFSLETRNKISKAKKGKASSKKGLKLTEKQLCKLRNKSKLCTKIVCLDTLQVFISQTDCAEKLKISHKHICNVCKGTRPHTFGYHFMYLDDFKNKFPENIDKLVFV